MPKELVIIGVIGGSEVSPEVVRLAEEVGREIARRKAALVCGGMGGVMEAACKGAIEEKGLTIGILPGENRKEANPFVQIPIATGIGYARNVAVVKSAQAIIAIDGSYGTLTEIGYALQSARPSVGLTASIHDWAGVSAAAIRSGGHCTSIHAHSIAPLMRK